MRKQTLPNGVGCNWLYHQRAEHQRQRLPDRRWFDPGRQCQSSTWELTESLPAADWHLGDISCTSTLGTSTFVKDLPNEKATVELVPGDTMDCTFTNVEDETITVEKVTIPGRRHDNFLRFHGQRLHRRLLPSRMGKANPSAWTPPPDRSP